MSWGGRCTAPSSFCYVFEQDRADEVGDRSFIGEPDNINIGSPLDFAVEVLDLVRAVQLARWSVARYPILLLTSAISLSSKDAE